MAANLARIELRRESRAAPAPGAIGEQAQIGPPSAGHKLKLMMEYARSYTVPEVPDPYDGRPEDFETVLEMLEDATEGLLEAIRSTHLK